MCCAFLQFALGATARRAKPMFNVLLLDPLSRRHTPIN
jgi:hypothetical protein